eukprot:scaffold568_cov233-Pinguiococcus_pyrenoidosus.AAC.2
MPTPHLAHGLVPDVHLLPAQEILHAHHRDMPLEVLHVEDVRHGQLVLAAGVAVQQVQELRRRQHQSPSALGSTHQCEDRDCLKRHADIVPAALVRFESHVAPVRRGVRADVQVLGPGQQGREVVAEAPVVGHARRARIRAFGCGGAAGIRSGQTCDRARDGHRGHLRHV